MQPNSNGSSTTHSEPVEATSSSSTSSSTASEPWSPSSDVLDKSENLRFECSLVLEVYGQPDQAQKTVTRMLHTLLAAGYPVKFVEAMGLVGDVDYSDGKLKIYGQPTR